MSCFYLLAIVNNAAVNLNMYLLLYLFSILLDLYLVVKLLGHTVIPFLTRIPVSPHPHQHSFSGFLKKILTILVSVK